MPFQFDIHWKENVAIWKKYLLFASMEVVILKILSIWFSSGSVEIGKGWNVMKIICQPSFHGMYKIVTWLNDYFSSKSSVCFMRFWL